MFTTNNKEVIFQVVEYLYVLPSKSRRYRTKDKIMRGPRFILTRTNYKSITSQAG